MPARPAELSPDGFWIDLATEADLPAVLEIQNEAFRAALKQLLGVTLPPGVGAADRLVSRFHRPDTRVVVLRDEHGAVQACNYLQRAGSRALPGPLAVRASWQRPWKAGVARALVERVIALAAEEGCAALDSVTFPHSAAHFGLYWDFGAPVRQAPFFSRATRGAGGLAVADGGLSFERFSALDAAARAGAIAEMRAITGRVCAGYDLGADAAHVAGRGIGETYLLREAGRLSGFAICHFGQGSEAFTPDQLLVKHLHVDPGAPRPREAFHALMQHVEESGRAAGLRAVGAMASTGRRASVQGLLDRGYAVAELHEQWLMLTTREAGASVEGAALSAFHPEHFALTEWR